MDRDRGSTSAPVPYPVPLPFQLWERAPRNVRPVTGLMCACPVSLPSPPVSPLLALCCLCRCFPSPVSFPPSSLPPPSPWPAPFPTPSH